MAEFDNASSGREGTFGRSLMNFINTVKRKPEKLIDEFLIKFIYDLILSILDKVMLAYKWYY